MKKYLALLAMCAAVPADAAIVTLNFSGSSYGFQGGGFDYQLTPFQVSYYTSFNNGVPYSFTFSYDTTSSAVGGKFPVSFSEMLIGGVNKTSDFTPYISFAQAGAYSYMNVTLEKTETFGPNSYKSYAFFSLGDNDGDIVLNSLPTVAQTGVYDFVIASFDVRGREGAWRTLYNSDSRGFSIVPQQAVPEPASWALMIGGFGLLGGALRRRTAIKAAFA